MTANCPYCAAALEPSATQCATCGAALTSQTLEAGTPIAGKYRVERVLGQGGFGITYLALDTALEHRVAVKELFPMGSTRRGSSVVPPPGGDFQEVKEKFLEEARVVQRFNHPNIVRVYGTFTENDTAYIVMEALEGETLGAEIAAQGALPESRVLEIARQLCAALEVVHAAGLLHRDIKPDNVFLADDGRVVLIDFGSARAFARGQIKKHTRLVTPGYAAPEQYATQAAFGTFTDVFGLAATLYHALEGRMPPLATDLMLGTKLGFEKTKTMRAGLEAGMRVNVNERTRSARAFLLELRVAHQTTASQTTVPEPPPQPVVVAPTAPKPREVLGWLFETDALSKGMNRITYQKVTAILVRKQGVTELNYGEIFFTLIGFAAVSWFLAWATATPWAWLWLLVALLRLIFQPPVSASYEQFQVIVELNQRGIGVVLEETGLRGDAYRLASTIADHTGIGWRFA